MLAKITNYTNKRHKLYALFTLIVFILPFIKLNGNHFFLLSFVDYKLNIFFMAFNIQELYLMPFLIMTFFLMILFVTTLAGRVWCAWACPQTIFRFIYRDLLQTSIFKIHKSIKNKQKPAPGHFLSKLISTIIFYLLTLIFISNILWYFIPPEQFFAYLKDFGNHTFLFGIVFIASLAFTFDIVFIKEKFCVYVCPYARIQSTMFDDDTIQVIYDEQRGGVIYDQKQRGTLYHHKKIENPQLNECINCEACVHVCPTHIDIREGMQLDCINCLECSDACSHVQARFNRPSLISWTSINSLKSKLPVRWLRIRTAGYMGVLVVILIASFFVGKNKEYMLLNINRTAELYNISTNMNGEKELTNAYIFLFQNIDDKPHKYAFSVEDKNIKIIRPKNYTSLKAGGKIKRIVVLKAVAGYEKLHGSKPISIKAYAIDDKKIQITRKTIFAYPKI